MSPELKQTLEIIIAGMSLLICLVLLVSFSILANKLRELRKEIREKNWILRCYKKDVTEYVISIHQLDKKIKQYEFVMAIADEISADMFKDNERLHREVELLKAKLNHKKRPTK